MDQGRELAGPFRLLFVCTGNVCRSVLAEHLASGELRRRLGQQADAVAISSSGTGSLVGEPMDSGAAEALVRLGGDPSDHVARDLAVDQVREADLILTATRAHRGAVARLDPRASRRTFTIREFDRLVAGVDPADLPADGDGKTRMRAVVEEAAARRGLIAAVDAEEDNLPDPYRGPAELHERTARTTAAALARPLDLLVSAVTGEPLARTDGEAPNRPAPPTFPPPSTPPPPTPARGVARGRRRRAVVAVILGLLVLLVAAAAWIAVRGLGAERELRAARSDADRLRTMLLGNDPGGSQRVLGDVQRHAGRARTLTSDPVWRTASALPLVGDDLRAVSSVAAAVDDIGERVLPPLVTVGPTVAPGELRVSGDRIALDPLIDAQPALSTSAAGAAQVQEDLARVPVDGLFGFVRRGVLDARRTSDDLRSATAGAASAARLLPPMLGADGRRRYFLAFQNNAEARGTGGLLGAYGILEADQGRVRVTHLGPNTELRSPEHLPLDFGPDYRALYGGDPTLVANANLSPHFPYAAQLWLEDYRLQTSRRLDGVVATDPVAMGYVLDATGPARLGSGEQVSSANAVDLTLRDVYARFPEDNARRDLFLQQVAKAVFSKLLGGKGEPAALARSLGRAAGEGRLLVYSRRDQEQQELAGTPLGGTLPDADGPYAGLVINNGAGSKMDYYLRRSLRYVGDSCADGRRPSRIEITLHNDVPAGPLPPYVTARQDRDAVTRKEKAPKGSNVALVQVYATKGATLTGASLDGEPLALSRGVERGRPVIAFRLALAPGQARTAVLELSEPAVGGTPQVRVQPLVQPADITTSLASC